MSSVFVTGASGQIGLRLVAELKRRGFQVTGLCRREAGAEALRALGATAVVGGLADREKVRAGLAGATVVYHLAGGVHGKGSETADVLNRQGTAQLLEALSGQRLESLVFASSCAVYGDRNGLWVREDYPPSPHTLYGESKVAAEQLLLASGHPVQIARIAAVYGPDFRLLQVEQMRRGRAWLPGEGQNFLPLVHVDDCVAALLLLAEKGKGIYHIVGRTTPQLKEFYAEVHRHAGGTPLRFWSTWIPSALQFQIAALNLSLMEKLGRKPRFTADNLRLFTAGVRMKTERLEKELGFTWKYGDYKEGLAACFGS